MKSDRVIKVFELDDTWMREGYGWGQRQAAYTDRVRGSSEVGFMPPLTSREEVVDTPEDDRENTVIETLKRIISRKR